MSGFTNDHPLLRQMANKPKSVAQEEAELLDTMRSDPLPDGRIYYKAGKLRPVRSGVAIKMPEPR